MYGFRGFLFAAGGGVAIAAALWGLSMFSQTPTAPFLQRAANSSAARPEEALATPLVLPADDAALRYVRALQEGDWNTAIDLTEWMQERLAYVASQHNDLAAVDDARRQLAEELMQRSVAGNQLREEGIEDQYVFAPGTEIVAISEDAGRDDLEEMTQRRVWFRVTYPQKTRALRDLASVPLRSIVAGVNLSATGRVLKGNVVGNVDIAWESASYNWKEAPGD